MKKFRIYVESKTAITSSFEIEAKDYNQARALTRHMRLKKTDFKWKLGDYDVELGSFDVDGPVEVMDVEEVTE